MLNFTVHGFHHPVTNVLSPSSSLRATVPFGLYMASKGTDGCHRMLEKGMVHFHNITTHGWVVLVIMAPLKRRGFFYLWYWRSYRRGQIGYRTNRTDEHSETQEQWIQPRFLTDMGTCIALVMQSWHLGMICHDAIRFPILSRTCVNGHYGDLGKDVSLFLPVLMLMTLVLNTILRSIMYATQWNTTMQCLLASLGFLGGYAYLSSFRI